MPNVVGAVNNLWTRFNQYSPEEFRTDTNIGFVIGGLANKGLSHCEVAKDLVLRNKLSEAIILLRSAYEAAVITSYILSIPDDGRRANKALEYQEFSILVDYKDKLVSLEESQNLKNSRVVQERLRTWKNTIIERGLLRNDLYFKNRMSKELRRNRSNGSILDNHKELALALNNHFNSFESMKKALEQPDVEDAESLMHMGRMIYNAGSQVAHAHWHLVMDYNIGVDPEGQKVSPQLSKYFIFAGMLVLMMQFIRSLDKANLTIGLHNELVSDLAYAGHEILDAIRENRQSNTQLIEPITDLIKPITSSTVEGRRIIKRLLGNE